MSTLVHIDPSVGVLSVYFGQEPNYLRLWAESCGSNPSVTFHLVCDFKPDCTIPPNVHIHITSINDLHNRVKSVYGIESSHITPYKVCDLKPAFARLYPELLAEFAYWGYCDVDLIWGNIPLLLKKHGAFGSDIFGVCGPRYVSGPFALFRNTDRVNALHEVGDHHLQAFSNPSYVGFDEVGGRWAGPQPIKALVQANRAVSMTDLVYHFAERGELAIAMPHLTCEPSVNTGGRVRVLASGAGMRSLSPKTRARNEAGDLLFYHLVYNKREPFFSIHKEATLADMIYIDWSGLHPSRPNPIRHAVNSTLKVPIAGAWVAWQVVRLAARKAWRALRRSRSIR